MEAVRDRDLQQPVVGGVVLDLVDAVPVAVVGAQDGRVLVRVPAPFDGLAAGDLTERAGAVHNPAGALAVERLHQRRGRCSNTL